MGALELLKESAPPTSDSSWTHVKSHKGIEVFTRKDKKWPLYSKGRVVFKYPSSVVHQVLTDDTARKEWDELFDCSMHVSGNSMEQQQIIRLKSIWPVSVREFHIVRKQETSDDGVIRVWSESDGPFVGPKRGKYVLGQLYCMGVEIIPIDSGSCIVTVIICSNLNGYIPGPVLTRLNTLYPTMLSDVRKYLDKHHRAKL